MNAMLSRAEWRAVFRTTGSVSVRLMHRSLSMVGLTAVVIGIGAYTHPEYARAVGVWILPHRDVLPAITLDTTPDPLTSALAETGGHAGRMLGLIDTPTVASADAAAAAEAAAAADVAPAVSMRKVTIDQRPVARQEKRQVVAFLSKKYRVNSDAVSILVDAAYVTGRELDLDPLLLLSVIGVESGFNPFAQSTAGASGLMQLMAKVHRDKLDDFGGANIALNPVVNLRVGAVVLKDCIRRGGSIADGLRLYVGAGMGSDGGYGARVLQEKDRLSQAVRGGPAPRLAPAPEMATKAAARPADIDHSFDTVDPSTIKTDDATGRVAIL